MDIQACAPSSDDRGGKRVNCVACRGEVHAVPSQSFECQSLESHACTTGPFLLGAACPSLHWASWGTSTFPLNKIRASKAGLRSPAVVVRFVEIMQAIG